jgi:hypothetical protein
VVAFQAAVTKIHQADLKAFIASYIEEEYSVHPKLALIILAQFCLAKFIH